MISRAGHRNQRFGLARQSSSGVIESHWSVRWLNGRHRYISRDSEIQRLRDVNRREHIRVGNPVNKRAWAHEGYWIIGGRLQSTLPWQRDDTRRPFMKQRLSDRVDKLARTILSRWWERTRRTEAAPTNRYTISPGIHFPADTTSSRDAAAVVRWDDLWRHHNNYYRRPHFFPKFYCESQTFILNCVKINCFKDKGNN